MFVAVMSRIWFVFWAGLLVAATDIVTHGNNNSSQCPEFCAAATASEFICHHVDGTCLHGCQPGYQGAKCDERCVRGTYGKDCNSDCPQHCMKSVISEPVCHHVSAVCTQGCMPGFRGVRCDQPCDPRTYGKDCSSPCPEHCEIFDPNRPVCHRVSGACTQGCKPGYQGTDCNEKCGDGTYGQDCSYDCPQHCDSTDRNQSVCNHLSGICTQGCKAGRKGVLCVEECDCETYGQDCSSACPQHCRNTDINRSVCHSVSGACIQGCQPGYNGIHCGEKCSRGTYGQDCTYDCPQYCENTDCDHVSGICTQGCKSGHKGILCDEECDRGTFGQDCNSTCPQYCENTDVSRSVCHHTSGVCTQLCQPGYTGLFCDEPCANGTYGENCVNSCPAFCDQSGEHASVCHHIKGVCLNGCQHGRMGEFCDQECERGYYGKNCNKSCPQFCAADDPSQLVCDYIDGSCLQGCQAGYHGPMCAKQCEPGYYGKNCNKSCPQFCAADDPNQLVCNYIDGSCLQGCQAGYHGPMCAEPCDNDHYGKGCGNICPEFCASLDIDKPICHHISGECLQGCQASYRGPHCSDNCEPGWFGSGCKYKCHCLDKNTCWTINSCIVNGETRCHWRWFGPACQYVDLANSDTIINMDQNLRILSDGNHTTCLQPGTMNIAVSWYQPYLLTWLRIHLRDAVTIVPEDFTNLFSVMFKHKNGTAYRCRNLQLARYSQTAIDVHCEPEVPVTQLILTGPGVGSLCTVYISGGRNVALKEKTSQTSTSSQSSGIKLESFLAVDGNTNKTSQSRECTLTDEGDPRPRWNIQFSHPMTLNRFVLHNTFKKNFWLMGFILTAFGIDGEGTFSYRDSLKKAMLVYTVVPPQELSALSGLSIEATARSVKKKYLALCEVEVFGDSVCPLGLYGRDCENHCLCSHAEQPCFVSTGGCPITSSLVE